jgi:hypothetical protein
VNEVELAHLADDIERSGAGRSELGPTVWLLAPGSSTKRERALLELELRRRGLDVQVNEGTIIGLDIKLERLR